MNTEATERIISDILAISRSLNKIYLKRKLIFDSVVGSNEDIEEALKVGVERGLLERGELMDLGFHHICYRVL